MADFLLRGAEEADSPAIHALVRSSRLNPTGLDWRRFIVAVTPDEVVIGCGQIKPHKDGTRELASLVVEPSSRNRGVARAIIHRLLVENPPPLYLMCRVELCSFYQKFGFVSIHSKDLPRFFQQMQKLSRVFLPMEIQVMMNNGRGES